MMTRELFDELIDIALVDRAAATAEFDKYRCVAAGQAEFFRTPHLAPIKHSTMIAVLEVAPLQLATAHEFNSISDEDMRAFEDEEIEIYHGLVGVENKADKYFHEQTLRLGPIEAPVPVEAFEFEFDLSEFSKPQAEQMALAHVARSPELITTPMAPFAIADDERRPVSKRIAKQIALPLAAPPVVKKAEKQVSPLTVLHDQQRIAGRSWAETIPLIAVAIVVALGNVARIFWIVSRAVIIVVGGVALGIILASCETKSYDRSEMPDNWEPGDDPIKRKDP